MYLSFITYINAIPNYLNFYVYKIHLTRNYLSNNITNRLLNSLVISRIDFSEFECLEFGSQQIR